MTLLCKSLDYAACPFEVDPRESMCREAGACAVSGDCCPISLLACEQQCSDTRCAAIEEDCS